MVQCLYETSEQVNDPLLEGRLDALDRELMLAVEHEWVQTFPASADLREDVWTSFKGSIAQPAQALRGRIDAIRTNLKNSSNDEDALKRAWAEYADVHEESQELFSEFLEFIGGLTFRTLSKGGAVLHVADEIVRMCSKEAMPAEEWRSITVPSRQEAVRATLARLIRLHFPEQTIWTLPLVTHDFGLVIMEVKPLQQVVEEQAKVWAGSKFRLGGAKAMDRVAARRRIVELGADSFAAFYTGPAYACASILLKLDLFDPGFRSPSSRTASRVHVILQTLRDMDKRAGGSYANVIERLQGDWDRAVLATGSRALDRGEKERLDEFAAALHKDFTYKLLPTAEYQRSSPSAGWLTAEAWFQHWNDQIGREVLSVPDGVSQLSELRDALNAVWLFRLNHTHPDNSGQFTEPCLFNGQAAEAALDLSRLIIEKRSKPKAASGQAPKDLR